MSGRAGTAVTLPLTGVQLDCGCVQEYRVSPPIAGDHVICVEHGATRVVKRVGGNKRVVDDPKVRK
jgi:hypothetical protein